MVPRRGTGIVRTRGGEGSGRRSGGGGGDGGGGIARERKSLLSPTERARDKPKREREGGGGGGRGGGRGRERKGERKRENWTTMTVAAAAVVRRRVGQHRADTEKKRATTSRLLTGLNGIYPKTDHATAIDATVSSPRIPRIPSRSIDRPSIDRSSVLVGNFADRWRCALADDSRSSSGSVRTNARGSGGGLLFYRSFT